MQSRPRPVLPEDVMDDQNKDSDSDSESSTVDIRKFFPETFLWDLITINRAGRPVDKSVALPDTITEWFGNAVCMNKNTGLGVSDFASITTFLNFFIRLDLPYSIVRGESVHILVLIFSFIRSCHNFKVVLTDQASFDLLSSAEQTVYICGGQSDSVTFLIKPRIIGDIELTVVATTTTTSISDGVTRMLPVEAEGIEKSYSFSDYMCAPYSVTTELPLPVVYVPDSERGMISVIGDIMGPALSNLDHLISLPYGCGEQTMILMAPGVFVMQYLTAINQVTSSIQSKAIDAMTKGYQRELTFKHTDGSYSAWGQGDTSGGSIWLTSFVVKVFGLADPFIYIDPNEQLVSINWIISHQQTDGCFPQVGRVIDRSLLGGLVSGGSTALSAFILISLLESNNAAAASAITAGMGCLDTPDISSLGTYPLSMLAYAYSLHDPDSTRLQAIMNELDSRAIVEGSTKHWEEDDQNTVPTNTWWYYHPPSADIEITAYILLANIQMDGTQAIGPGLSVVRWLSAQRNAFGGFYSTQDTVMGLQALAAYASLIFGGQQNLAVTVTPPSVVFTVDASNFQLLQTSPVSVPRTINIDVTGSGCALVQADVWYNVWPPPSTDDAFSVVVTPNISSGCESATLRICVRYLRDDGPTNMALVQVKMVSGWVPDDVPGPADDSNISQVEIEKKTVTIYFDQLTDRETCFNIVVQRANIVDDVKPAPVVVWDYYRPEKTSSTSYNLDC